MIMKLNPLFTRVYDAAGEEMLIYKHKTPLIVVDYERMAGPTPEDYYRYKDVRLESRVHSKKSSFWCLMNNCQE